MVVTVSLNTHRKADFEHFEARVSALSEITECVATGGGMDYVMKVVTPDMAHFQQVMDTLLSEELGIDRYITYFVTRVIKSTQPDLKRLVDS